MGMLGRMLSSIRPAAAAAPAPALAAMAAPGPAPAYVWQALSGTTGVQSAEYADDPRTEIRPLFDHVPRRVLDIGCATGAAGLALKRTDGAWVWGCELDGAAAAVAATRLDRVTTQPISQWADEELALLRTIDTVLLLDVLEHMYNPWGELQFLARHLPADAQVIVSLPNLGHLSTFHNLSLGAFTYDREGILDVTHVRFFTRREMLDMFAQTGFSTAQEVVLAGEPEVEVTAFPLQARMGRCTLEVADAHEWRLLHAVRLGFRLRVGAD